MRIIRFNDLANSLKLQPDSFEDLYLLARIISPGDIVEGRSFRRFQNEEGEKGEQKEVFLKISVEKTELDKSGERLRLTGKILSGNPEELVRIGSYHTINVGAGDAITITKKEWKDYILRRIKEAVNDTKKIKFGAIALDDEKATVANIRGYGIEVIAEVYSHLSKRMKEQDYEKARKQYFDEIINIMKNMNADTVLIAGPGFTREDLKRYIESNRIDVGKKLLFVPVSDAERSGIREAVQSGELAQFFEHEHLRKEFRLLNLFMQALQLGSAAYGLEGVGASLDSYEAGIVLVNDDLLNREDVQNLLDRADKQRVSIEIFNSSDEAGMQLAGFKGIASIFKSALAGV
ncbi:MAG: mRNA surveillance protein pelota [Candidatus Micrarchaeia archaeon]